MDRPTNLGQLNTGQWDRLHAILERFDRAWQEADTVVLDEFVPPPGDPLRVLVLQELIRSDLDNRWRRQQNIYLEDYLARFPDLGSPQTVPVALIHQEYCVRQRYAGRPELASYQARFPEQFVDLQRVLQEQPPPFTDVPGTRVPDPSAGTLTPAAASPVLSPLVPLRHEVLPVGGGYMLLQRLGRGSFGEVFKAAAPGGVEVAVKIIYRTLNHAEAQRELQALELIRGLRHNFLLQTQAFWALEDKLVIVMDLADSSLRDRLAQCRDQGQTGIPLDELLGYFHEAAEALDFLHGHDVQHRDIKPDNILLLGRHVKVADFGLARLQGGRSMITATGSGTPGYMPPEVWNNKVHQHSDQYSLAATYVELRLDHRPFASDNLPALMLEILQGSPRLDPLPPAEQEVLLRALAKEPGQRFPSCGAFVQALEQAVRGGQQEQEETQPKRPAWRHAWWAVPLAAGLMALLVVLGIRFWPPSEAESRRPVAPSSRPPVAWLLPDIEPAADAQVVEVGGLKLYDHLEKVVQDQRISFRLIPHEADFDPPTFYIMENKVSNDLFALALAAPAFCNLLDEAAKTHPQTIQRQWKLGGLGEDGKPLGIAGKGDWPVLRVTVTEAYLFARWLGGNLPTVEQWDKAGGNLNGDLQPCMGGPWGPKDIAINRLREGPMPVGTAAKDISRFQCRDMAGNGQEWTRTLRQAGKTVPAANPSEKLSVIVRSRSYRAPEPFAFGDQPESLSYVKADALISFRVVLEPSLGP